MFTTLVAAADTLYQRFFQSHGNIREMVQLAQSLPPTTSSQMSSPSAYKVEGFGRPVDGTQASLLADDVALSHVLVKTGSTIFGTPLPGHLGELTMD